ncbi:MAG: hypothetical protein EXR71_00775 [Myxococcales bacterium]|nr:hypothetical protein [Myxococcales bacterium]
MLVLVLFGCLDPFPTDRHDLVDLRIVGMRRDGAGRLDAYVWEGSEAWSPVAPERVWGGDAVCVEGECTLAGGRDATLTIRGQDGEESGVLETDAETASPTLAGFTRVVEDAVATVQVDVPGAERVRWMAPAGEIAEIDALTTTFTPPGPGLWPLVALWLDGHGGNGWATIDVPVGDVGPLFEAGTRLLPIDGAVIGSVLATLGESDELLGFALTGAVLDDGSVLDPVCGDEGGIWDPDALVERRCGRDEVLGKRVRLSGSVVP